MPIRSTTRCRGTSRAVEAATISSSAANTNTSARDRRRRTTPNGTFTFRTDQPFNASDPRTYPERLQIRVPGPLNRYQKAHFVAAFAQDKWRLTNRTTLSLGLRYDLEIQPIAEVDNPDVSDPHAYPLDKNNLAPRVGLTYDLSGDGRASCVADTAASTTRRTSS